MPEGRGKKYFGAFAMRVYNFSPGPSALPLSVLERAAAEMTDYAGSGMSVAELSHRGKLYEEIHNRTIALLAELMGVPEGYRVLLLQGGASLQFEAVPLNLMSSGKADYVVTGVFAEKALKEAAKFGDARIAASSKDENFTYIPKLSRETFRADADYVHITSNNTIVGTRFREFPDAPAPVVCDMSSNILSEVMDIGKLGLIYAGAQKNLGPAGLTVVIVREELIGRHLGTCPTIMRYATQAAENSLYNTPPCFSIYVAMLVLEWVKAQGGVSAVQKLNEYKAGLLYDFIDDSGYYKNSVRPEFRSLMNVPFTTPSPETDGRFIKEAAEAGLVSLKGHRLVGGMRASIYNAMPQEGVEALVAFMKRFQVSNSL